jgi:hypothetical protein
LHFTRLGQQKQRLLQESCPIHVHCYQRAIDEDSGACIVQIRLVNRSERTADTVFLCIEGLSSGIVRYTMRALALVDCAAAPHSVFGENRVLMLERTPVDELRITVECVAFSDGMVWRRLPQQALVPADEAHCRICSCGLPNAKYAQCGLCGSSVVGTVPASSIPPVREDEPVETAVFAEAEETVSDVQSDEVDFVSEPIADAATPFDLTDVQLPDGEMNAQALEEYISDFFDSPNRDPQPLRPEPVLRESALFVAEEEESTPIWLKILLTILALIAVGSIAALVYFLLLR